jgi:rod shape-determining protein MreD
VPASRVATATALVVISLVLQVTLLSRLPLPGATPDLLLLVVVALALAHGPDFGLVTGFAAGLAYDLAPPADHTVGLWAFVLTLIGYAAGLARDESRRSAFVPLVVVALAAAASLFLYAGLGALMSDPHVSWPRVYQLLPTAVIYDVVLGPFVVSGVLLLVRRLEPDPAMRW